MKKILFLVNTDNFFISHRLPIAKRLLNGFGTYCFRIYKYRNQLKKLGFILMKLILKV